MREIREVAVIGAGGVAGLAAVYELLHTSEDGSSTVGTGQLPDKFFFTKIVGFEQKDDVGGTWYPQDDFSKDPYLPAPKVLETQKYDDVRILRYPNQHAPSSEQLSSSTVELPIVRDVDPEYIPWGKSAVWPRLYTNVPESYMRYSTTTRDDVSPKGLDPFLTHEQLRARMTNFAKTNDLKSRIRFNTEVYRVHKDSQTSKWILTLRCTEDSEQDKWYQESFDGVILAQGSFSIPYIPVIKGLSEFEKMYPGSVLHSKSFLEPTDFTNKRVVIVGGNISAIDIGQYISPLAKDVIVSRNLAREPYLPYMARCIRSFKNVEMIQEFLPYSKKLRLTNGELIHDVDNVILCTGYHIELPFLDAGVLEYSIPNNSKVPTSNSRIKGLYQHVFNIRDPSIAFVGKLIVQTLFRNMESQAAAIAGVWSGASDLPSNEQMRTWENERLATVDEHLFHKYDIYRLKKDFFDPMKRFYTKNRPDPIGVDDLLANLETYENSLVTFEKLFNEFRTGELDPHKDFNDDIPQQSYNNI